MKKFILVNSYSLLLNFIFLLLLLVGIQNSNKREKVNLIQYETIYLPVSFIAGTSFIFGSVYGGIIFSSLRFINMKNKVSKRYE